jgi:hypoxanthine phosphoribosyltransferase
MKNKRSSPVDELPGGHPELTDGIRQVLYTEEQIRQQVRELAQAISSDYAGRNPLMIGVLRGRLFMADLLRALTIPAEVDFIAVSSYSPEARAWDGAARHDLETSITGRHVLFIEDVIDTGSPSITFFRTCGRASLPVWKYVCFLINPAVACWISP